MKDLKKLLKAIEESKESILLQRHKFIKECDKEGTSTNYINSYKIGELTGRISALTDISNTIQRIIKQKENAKFEQSLKEIEEVMNILPVLVGLGIIK